MLDVKIRSALLSGLGAILCCIALAVPAAYGSSDLSAGRFSQMNLADGRELDLGYCQVFTTTHEEQYGYGQFLMILGDGQMADSYELALTGEFETNSQGRYSLHPDDDSAEAFLQLLLGDQVGESNLDVNLFKLAAGINIGNGLAQDGVRCWVRVEGNSVTDRGELSPVRLSFSGHGDYFNGALTDAGEPLTVASALASSGNAQAATCDNPRQSNFYGWAPIPDKCSTPDCLLDFAGYRWWTSFQYTLINNQYFYQGSQRQAYSPRNAFVDSEGLHLTVRKDNLGDGEVWASSEVVLAQNADGSIARLGYGTYLVAVRVKSAASWNQLDRNVAFGAFTYQFDPSGTDNPYHELDLAEISRWGHQPGGPCVEVLNSKLCNGNSQFTLQLWDRNDNNIKRYSIEQGINEITLVMEWKGAQQPVTFKQYNGLYSSIEALPATAAYEWTTSESQNSFVPEPGCQFFHMNLWLGNYYEKEWVTNKYGGKDHPPPSNGQPQEAVVTAFQYKPL